ncbi:transcription factor E2F7-like [Acipenser oxyrinchus oxyrinchus]|uniref:Transcription factor E2F7 n=1 Tax=Acipenser oxyrinchus oxyrinchus TaxID=40147 RepID=A0AAD8DEX6_ACIOX|nr:transcription factor E2F7-like [Acipenser oxyrinchus oxyrinchus]
MEGTGCLALKDLTSPRKTRTDLMEEADSNNDQKENIFVDRTKVIPKTPLKNDLTPTAPSKQKGCSTLETIHNTPIKHVDRPQADPWTPTANLKMLISAASPDIRDRDIKKGLFRPIENEEREETSSDTTQFDAMEDCTTDEFEKQRPNRKLKSLGLLCQKFLALYPDYPLSMEKTHISLDEVATNLGVERRRIYDIVNVLESLLLVSRVAKNQYRWHGRHKLCQTLEGLQSMGKQQRYEEQMAQLRETDCKPAELRRKESFPEPQEGQIDHTDIESDMTSGSASKRKDKSLRIMSQKFVMLFLVSKTKIVSLDIAAKILIDESQDAADHSKFKTKVRRLYDIANILTSLELIKKIHVTEERGRKPAFKWIGPVDFKHSIEASQAAAAVEHVSVILKEPLAPRPQLVVSGKHRLTRHASFSVLPASAADQRRISSAPSSPQRHRKGWTVEPEYSRKMAGLAAVCKLQFEESTRSKLSDRKTAVIPTSNSVSPGLVLTVPVDSHSRASLLPQSVCTFPQPQHVLPTFYPNAVKGGPSAPAESQREDSHSSSSQKQPPLVYLQSLPHPSVLMVCGSSLADRGGAAQRSSEAHSSPTAVTRETPALGKRSVAKSGLSKEEEQAAKRDRTAFRDTVSSHENCIREKNEQETSFQNGSVASPALILTPPPKGSLNKDQANQTRGCPETPFREGEPGRHSPEQPAPLSHYLYVPSSAGLSGLDFFLPAGHSPGSLSLSPSRLASLALPYVVLPSSALSSFPLIAPGLSGTNGSINFRMPGGVNPTHFLIAPGAVPCPRAPECSPSPKGLAPSPGHLSPEQERLPKAVTPESPVGVGHPLTVLTLQQQQQTPLTPKEVRAPHSKTFFQTPCTLGSAASSSLRKQGTRAQNRTGSSAQRRLEISNNVSN